MASRHAMTVRNRQSRVEPQSIWTSRSHVSTFVRCLHLLDLDLLEDWPAIDETVFTSPVAKQNLQTRIKAVEWSLYRLFELYNDEETKNKLRPFFPPHSSLQSVNLRAALYRCLADLKKNGVLGPQYQLRKTMLDECKGDKLEELLAGFAVIVLRRVAGGKDSSVMENNDKVKVDQVVPLIIAHRVLLQKAIYEQKSLRQDLARFRIEAEDGREKLKVRKKEVIARQTETDPVLQQQVTRLVNTSWIGNHAWSNLILNGLSPKPAYPLSRSQSSESAQPSQSTDDPVDILVDELDASIKKHQARLAEWRVIAKDLGKSQPAESRPNTKSSQENTFTIDSQKPLRFARHKQLSHKSSRSGVEPSLRMSRNYQTILNALQDDLSTGQSVRGQRKSQGASSSSKLLPEPYRRIETRDTLYQSHVSTSNSRSDELETYSVSSPTREVTFEDNLEQDTSPVSTLPDELSTTSWSNELKDRISTTKLTSPIKVSDCVQPPEIAIEQSVATPASPSQEWMSLMERTRVSMSNFGPYKDLVSSSRGNDAGDGKRLHARDNPNADWEPNPDEVLPATLVARTRHSMSLLSTANMKANRRKSQRLSQIFPINQFETPGKPRPRISEFGPSSESSTPREKLFEQEADYESVFKSRPRIAMSPTLSPDRSGIGFDSILEQDMEDLQLASDDEYD